MGDPMEAYAEDLTVLAHVAIGMALGGVIGLEREVAGKPAGFRTLMLVTGASTLLVHLSQALVEGFERGATAQPDPVRVMQAIVVGISFLGAGTIFRAADGVTGLTTAAAILFSSAIGIAVGLGEIVIALGGTALVLLALVAVRFTERLGWPRPRDADAPRPEPPARATSVDDPTRQRIGGSS